MEIKCPFCGANAIATVEWSQNSTTFDYECGTEGLPGGYVMTEDCKDNQIKYLRHLLAKVLPMVEAVARPTGEFYEPDLELYETVIHSKAGISLVAQDLLPELRKFLEVKF